MRGRGRGVKRPPIWNKQGSVSLAAMVVVSTPSYALYPGRLVRGPSRSHCAGRETVERAVVAARAGPGPGCGSGVQVAPAVRECVERTREAQRAARGGQRIIPTWINR